MLLLSELSLGDSQLIPSRLSPAKGGNAKTIANQTDPIFAKREPDEDTLPSTPIRATAKSKGKRPQRYSTPIEVSDSESDAPTPRAKSGGSALQSRALENMYVYPSSLASPILSSVCPLAHPHTLLLGNFVLMHPLGLYLLLFFVLSFMFRLASLYLKGRTFLIPLPL